MAADGLVLDMKSMDAILAVTDDWIEVEAGIAWSEAAACGDRAPSHAARRHRLAQRVGGRHTLDGRTSAS